MLALDLLSRRLSRCCAGLLAIGMCAADLRADFVVNPSFESDSLALDTWVYSASGWIATGDAGTFRPPSAAYPEGAPSGSNVGFVQSGWAMPTGILEQTTEIVLQAGMECQLLAKIGRRVDNPLIPWGGYVMSMYAGDTLLAQDLTESQPDAGMFVPASLFITIDAGEEAVGQLLRIRFEALYGQTNIDDVQVIVTPTPGSIALIVIGALALTSSRKRPAPLN